MPPVLPEVPTVRGGRVVVRDSTSSPSVMRVASVSVRDSTSSPSTVRVNVANCVVSVTRAVCDSHVGYLVRLNVSGADAVMGLHSGPPQSANATCLRIPAGMVTLRAASSATTTVETAAAVQPPLVAVMADVLVAQAFSVDCSTCSARTPDAVPGSAERATHAPAVGQVRQDCRTLTTTSATKVALCTSSATRLSGADTFVRRTVTSTPVTAALMLASPTPGA
jgi:hypothetical protein